MTTTIRAADPMIAELSYETEATQRVPDRVPADKLTWKPHHKSMTLGQLALHVATVFGSVGKVCMRLSRLPALAVVAVGVTGPLFAQATGPFDVSRAFLPDSSNPFSSSRMFYPFYVTRTQPLSEAVREQLVHDGTPLLILDHPAGRLALATEQMTYHHIAQGDIDGEPWMVYF